ncbi:MAG: LVIVD repeat-containing protein [Actinomycetota bacterium]
MSSRGLNTVHRIVRFIVALAVVAVPVTAAARTSEPYTYVAQGEAPGSFELVGAEPLGNRGMNAALAVHNGYAYIGSRTDAPKPGPDRGVMVVDVRKPAEPAVVGQIGEPQQGKEGETSREMRVWRSQNTLIVMNLGSNCSYLIHACSPRSVDDNFRFFDISGKNAANPKFIAEYVPSVNPHEFYLWEDPRKPKSALLFMSTPGGGTQYLVTDISGFRQKKFKELGKGIIGAEGTLHSITLSPDGKTAYLPHLEGGFLLGDTSDFVTGAKKPTLRVLTAPKDAANWEGPGVHSTVPIWGSDYVLATDEAYGDLLRALGSGGCPWGWARTINAANPKKPKVVAEYKLPENEQDYCTTDPPRPSSSYSAHNLTLTEHLAFVTWHAGGLQAINLSNPAKPTQAAVFVPEFLPYVFVEDPALSAGQDKVVTWSFPIISDGLIYMVDIRNGLYILKYKGPFASEVAKTDFLEGNSNQGEALRLGRL